MNEPDIRPCFDGDQSSVYQLVLRRGAMIRGRIRVACVIVALVTLVSGTAAQIKLTEVSPTTENYRALHAAALTFVEAVRHRDESRLIELALPEWKDRVRADLHDRRSGLSQILFDGPHAVRKRFDRIQTTRVVLLPHPDLVDSGNGTTVCVVDSGDEFDTPRTIDDVPAVEDGKEVCVFFMHAQARWFLGYGFAYPH
jgi:hypothetical protein